jgi:hypothetical protein
MAKVTDNAVWFVWSCLDDSASPNWRGVSCNPAHVPGLALLELRARVEGDPHGVFEDWDPMDNNPCSWSGVQCSDGNVEIL